MPDRKAVLHMLCGKIAAGKSTLSAKLAADAGTILISEDRWVAQLYPSEIKSLADYFERSARLRATLTPHVVSLLRTGISVVLDFHANTVASRRWMRSLFEEAGADHRLHVLDPPDEVCRARMHARKAAGGDGVTDAEFDYMTSRFEAPRPEEGFTIVRYADE